MANIDNLNFKVILDDEKFDEKINRDIELAKQLNVQLSALLNVKSRVSNTKMVGDATKAARFQKATADAAAAQERLKTASTNTAAAQERLAAATANAANAQERLKQSQMRTEQLAKRITAQTERQNKAYTQQSRILNELKGLALGYLSIHGASQLLSSLVRVTGEFELQKTTLAAMLGDLNQTEGIITRIQGLAVESPFQFKELTTYAKQLSAFSVPAQELYDTTKMLADVSAGLGVGMDRIVLAYGQVRSAAFLRGQEVRQFTEAGIPILDELAKQFSELEGRAVSTGEVFDKISARLVPFEMVAKVFKDMTSEGGKFYNMQEVQAETLRGKISNLKDAYEMMLNEIGEKQSERLKGAVDWTRRLMQYYEDIGESIISLVAAYGAYKTALILAELATDSFNVANHRLLNSIKRISLAIISNPYAVLTAGLAAVVGLTAKGLLTQTKYQRALEVTNKTLQTYNSNIASETSALEYLFDRMKKLTVGTQEYNDVKSQVIKEFGQYLTDVDKESLAIGNLADAYDKLKISIVEANREKALSEGSQGISQVYSTELNRIFTEFDSLIKTAGINNKGTRIALSDYIRGAIGFEDLPEEIQKNINKAIAQVKSMENGGIGGSKQSLAWFDLNKLREEIETLDQITYDAREKLSENLRIIYGPMPSPKKTEEELSQFVRTVQETLGKFGATKEKKGQYASLWAESTTEYYGYLDDLRKGYTEIQKKIKDVGLTQRANLPNLEKQKEAYEAIAKALGVSLEEEKKGGGKTADQKAIEEQIKSVQKLQDAYEKLMPYLNEVQMKSTLKSLFPNISEGVIDSLDFNAELERLADELAKFDKDAAQRLRDTIGKDVAGTIAESFKAVEQYKKMLDSWLGEDFNLSGEGVAFDISKIISNLNSKYAKIDQKRAKALDMLNKAQMGDEESLKIVRETYGEEVWQKYLENGAATINELARLEREEARKTADEKIRDLADNYVRERLSKENVNLTDFGDKTLKQIDDILDRVRTIYQETNTKLQLMELDVISEEELAECEMLKESLKQLGIILGDVVVERTKEANDVLKDSFNAIGTLAGDIGALGEALGSAGIASAAKDLSDMASMASKLVDAFEAKDTIAIIANIASAVISKVTDVVTASYEQQRKLNEAASEYRDIMLDIRREAYSGVFGTDEMALAAENQRILTDSLADYADSLKAFEEDKKLRNQKFFGNRLEFKKMSVSDVVGNIADAQGWDLYRENGELNMEALKAYYDAYSEHLTKKQRDVVDALIASYDAQNDAAAQSAEYLTGLFSGVADNIAESMIDAFLESGDAAIDMGNIISDVSRQMVADLIKSIYLMPILNKYKEDIEKVGDNTALSPTEKTEQQLNLLDTALQEIAGQSDRITETIERFEDYLRSPEDEGTSALGEGIKGITEDQANLLASYLNAIRADVAYSKTLWVRMDANLQRIADMFTSSPTLMEYQAQIAANTYNTAIATQEILSQLRSVVTTDSGDTAIRVYS